MMRSLSTNALGQPRETKLTFGARRSSIASARVNGIGWELTARCGNCKSCRTDKARFAIPFEPTGTYGSPARAGNIGGGTRRLEAAWYADAAFSARCSMPGSTRKLIENGRPGAGISVGSVLVTLRYTLRPL